MTSGCVLVLEILAGRLLAPYVGVTLQTYTGVIGTVLAGIALGTWWAELFEVPAIALAGSDLASVDILAETGVEFVALRAAAWDHPDGPRAAVAEANTRLDTVAGPLSL